MREEPICEPFPFRKVSLTVQLVEPVLMKPMLVLKRGDLLTGLISRFDSP